MDMVCTSNPRTGAVSGGWITEFKTSLVVGQPGLYSEALCSVCLSALCMLVHLCNWLCVEMRGNVCYFS